MNYNFEPYVRFVAKSTYLIEDKLIIARDARLLYIISGNADFECDGRIYKLEPGTLIYYPYDKPYRFTSNDGLLFYSLNFDFTKDYSTINTMRPLPVSEHASSTVLRTAYATDTDVFKSVVFLPDAVFARADIQAIYTEQLKKGEGYAEMQALLLKKVIINIFRTLTDLKVNPLSESIKNLILNRKDIKIKEIAEIMGYHPFYLNEMFKKQEGITLHKYIMQEKLIMAYELLTATKMTLEEISAECGFSSQTHFSSAFKSMYNVSPGRLRRQL